jgi:sulfoxide reductase catalytic subunit YedY
MGLILGSIGRGARALWANTKRIILGKDTRRESLIHYNPVELDTSNLNVTPLDDFGTMGVTEFSADIKKWRLEVGGDVETPLRFTYEEILSMPSIERKVLLICPGVFANHGNWKGISIARLLHMAGIKEVLTHVEVRGPDASRQKVVKYAAADILTDKVFLAYAVNGRTLPQKHGFPLRIVAEDYFGYDWVKYAYSVKALRT